MFSPIDGKDRLEKEKIVLCISTQYTGADHLLYKRVAFTSRLLRNGLVSNAKYALNVELAGMEEPLYE